MQDVLLVPTNCLEAQRGQMYVQAASIKIGMAEIAPVLGAFVHGIAASNTDSQTEATACHKQRLKHQHTSSKAWHIRYRYAVQFHMTGCRPAHLLRNLM